MKHNARVPVLLILFLVLAHVPARSAEDRVQFVREIIIDPGQSIGDAVCFFCSIHVRGTLEGDAVAIGGGIDVEGAVGGDIVSAGGGVRLGPAARVEGEVVAVGGPLERHPRARIEQDMESTPWFHLPGQRQFFWRGLVMFLAINATLALASVLASRKRRVETMAKGLRHRPFLSLLAGIGALVVSAALFFVANHLGRSQPIVAGGLALVLLIAAAVGYMGLTVSLAQRMARSSSQRVRVLLAAALLALLQLIPIVGFIAFQVLFLLAVGCAVLGSFARVSRPVLAESPKPA